MYKMMVKIVPTFIYFALIVYFGIYHLIKY